MTRYLMLLMVSVPLALAAGCGSDDTGSSPPSRAAAKVGNTVLSDTDVLRVSPLVAPVNSTDHSGVGHPPEFTDCIAASRKENKGASTAAIRKACSKQYETNRIYAAGYLIKRTWSMMEARRRGIEPGVEVGRERLRTQLETTKPEIARRLLSVDRDRRALATLARTQTRDLRLSKALHLEIGEQLDQALLRRYGKQTKCAPRYKAAGIPECNGSVQSY
jgi:hypothetical protein